MLERQVFGNAQVAMARRDLALRLRDARRADRRLETVAQFKQAMTAPDWEIDDYDWRAPLPLVWRQVFASRRVLHARLRSWQQEHCAAKTAA